MEPFVSVIIPVYNEEQFVVECVKSVLSQPCKDLEIILLDDGSKDNSSVICSKLATTDRRVKFVKKTNTGVSDTRNKGIELASGQFIAFLDSDDRWVDGVFTEECKYEIIESKCDIAAFAYNMSYSDINDVYMTTWPDDSKGAVGDKAVDCTFTPFCANFYSRELIDKTNIQFDATVRYLEDIIFKNQLLFSARNVYRMNDAINKPLFTYRSNPHSACHTANEKAFQEAVLFAFKEIHNYCQKRRNSNNDYYNAQEGMLFVRAAKGFCNICRSYDEWKSIFVLNDVINVIYGEITAGLSVPANLRSSICALYDNPKRYYYSNRVYLKYRAIRRYIYRLFSLKLLKK